jgi:ATP-dependent exoDNAse (exonuclease V) alpha subunit
MIQLYEKQQIAHDKVLELLRTNRIVVLSGSAGVGKTALVDVLSSNLASDRIVFSAPTNKAVRVLMKSVTMSGATFSTTHSALKLKRKIDNRTGAISFKPSFSDFDKPLQGVDYLIIDEASMLNTELLNYVKEFSNDMGVKVILIGDRKQLPPVKEKVSPVFTSNFPEVELTEIIRQKKGNPIIDLSRNILPTIKTKVSKHSVEDGRAVNGYVFSKESGRILKTLAKANGTDEAKYLAWTNKEVDAVNNKVRELIYGGNPAKIELGETIVLNAPYGDKFYANEEITINTLRTEKITVRHKYAATQLFGSGDIVEIELMVYVINEGSGVHINKRFPKGILVIHEDSQNDFDAWKQDYLQQCKTRTKFWKDYYATFEQFADFKYNHALTVHKSQGSSFDKTIVNVANICLNNNTSERDKMLYTAVTRSSNLLILYNA